jgi:hypothetical protein
MGIAIYTAQLIEDGQQFWASVIGSLLITFGALYGWDRYKMYSNDNAKVVNATDLHGKPVEMLYWEKK